MIPTYVFLLSLFAMIGFGMWHVAMTGGHPHPIVAPPILPPATITTLSFWLLLRVFASGCTAMTGVEAVSNGAMAFRDPRTRNGQATLTIIVSALIMLLAGIAWLCRVYGIGATQPDSAGYQSVLSQLLGAVAGHGVFYYVRDGVHPRGAGAFRQYGLCGFPAPYPRHRAQQLPASRLYHARDAACFIRGAFTCSQALRLCCSLSSAASRTGLSRSMQSVRSLRLHSRRLAWLCTGLENAATATASR